MFSGKYHISSYQASLFNLYPPSGNTRLARQDARGPAGAWHQLAEDPLHQALMTLQTSTRPFKAGNPWSTKKVILERGPSGRSVGSTVS